MKFRSSALGLVLAMSGMGTVIAQSATLQTQVEEMVAACGAPGGVLAFWDGEGADVEVRVAGLRSVNNDDLITGEDLWHIGSNTKAMTATLAARLVERGVVRWEDTIEEVLGEGHDFAINPAYLDVTLEDLLNHTSGMSANVSMFQFIRFVGADEERDEELDRVEYTRVALAEKPGGSRGAFIYSNTGFVIAGLMLETRAGEPYEVLMQREVFDPLGMDSAGWGPPLGEDQPEGHVPGLFRGPRAVGTRDNPPALNSAGRVHISARDHMKFLIAHVREASGPSADYLSQASWDKLHTPLPDHDYVMGWGLYRGLLAHAGSNTAWIEQIAFDPKGQKAALAGVNYGHQGKCMPATGEVLMKLLAIDPE
ncbi:serine hydrolase domain-containing protein [Woodsholea maritima]|uniref:serine hydrolase domain-containing protein n=1 Tax=Woodsholea maritima TaxID=240237 RepID=UPI0003644B46|nr:serine hydrolase domain-containing protein [Woodsholea maritima]